MGIHELLFEKTGDRVDLGEVTIDYDHDVATDLPPKYRGHFRQKGVITFRAYAVRVGILKPCTQHDYLADAREGVLVAQRCKSLHGKNILFLASMYDLVTHDLVFCAMEREGQPRLCEITVPKKIGGESLTRQEISLLLTKQKAKDWHILRLAKVH